jgi:hypothetical protein
LSNFWTCGTLMDGLLSTAEQREALGSVFYGRM